MVVISCIVMTDNGPAQYLSDVNLSWWNFQKEDRYTDVVLVSGQLQVRVHRGILIRVSSFLHGLVPPSCSCETPAITLPRVQPNTLKALVELAYTGRSKVESRKAKEEFEELTKVLQIGLTIEYHESADQATRANRVSSVIVKAPRLKITSAENVDTDEPNKSEEKAAAEKRNDEKISASEGKKSEDKADDDKREAEEKAAAAENKKAGGEGYAATEREKCEEQADVQRSKHEQRASSDEGRKKEEKTKDAVAEISFEEKKKKEENDKKTNMKDSEVTVETEFITAMGLNRFIIKKTTVPNQKGETKPTSGNMIKKASPVKVGGSVRLTRSRRKKSTVQETQAIPFLSPISRRKRMDSPDSIHAQRNRNQKRKIPTFLNFSDEIDVITEPKRKKVDLVLQPTEESSRFVNIQDVTADSIVDEDMLEENFVKENNNGLVQDPIEVNTANDSIEDPLKNMDMSIFSDEGEDISKRNKFVCPFCEKEFQKKPRYDYHLSCHHFQAEISDKFPGMECVVCKKSFRKKSNYIAHMGSFHKIIDGFMEIAQIREDKMAQIRETKQHKPFTSPQAEREDDSWMESLRRKNTSTPNEKRLRDEILDTPKQSTEDEEADGNHNKVETIEDIQAFINELPKSKL